MCVVGEKEIASGDLAVRARTMGDIGTIPVDQLFDQIVPPPRLSPVGLESPSSSPSLGRNRRTQGPLLPVPLLRPGRRLPRRRRRRRRRHHRRRRLRHEQVQRNQGQGQGRRLRPRHEIPRVHPLQRRQRPPQRRHLLGRARQPAEDRHDHVGLHRRDLHHHRGDPRREIQHPQKPGHRPLRRICHPIRSDRL